MREYETNNDIVNIAHGTFPFDTSPVASPKTTNQHQSELSSSSRMSLLTSSTISLAHRQFLDWPEFEENYNSIMDNTNLLDSCAAALSDITYGDDDRSFVNSFEKHCHVFRQSIGSDHDSAKTSSSGSLSTQDTSDSITKLMSQRVLKEFVRWLDYMEQRIELLPTLGKIVAMSTSEMIEQYNAHKRIFKDIVAQPCIIKGDSHNTDYKAIEERYHLLYLKVYEVLLLLEDIPDPDVSVENTLSTSIVDLNATHNVLTDSSSNSDKSESLAASASMYTRTNIMSRSIGTFYFKHDDTASEQTSTDKRTFSVGNIYEEIDKECEWKSDVNTLVFDAADKKWTGYDACTASISRQSSLQRQLCQDDSMTQTSHQQQQQEHRQQQSEQLEQQPVQHKSIRRRYTIDSCTSIKHQQHPLSLSFPMQLNAFDRRHSIDTIDHKVREWLNSKTIYSTNSKSKSSWPSLMGAMDTDVDDLHALYRSKSDLNLPIYRCTSEMRTNYTAVAAAPATSAFTSSFRASTNSLPLTVVANDTPSSSTYDITSTESLEWDSFAPDLTALPNGIVNNDNEISAMSEKLCYFGEDYSQQLDAKSIATSSTTEVNNILADSTSKQATASQASVDHSEMVAANVKKRTGRQRQQKVLRAKRRAFHSILKMSQNTYDTGQQTPKRTTAEASTETEPIEKCCQQSETLETLITYNNTDKQFELRGSDPSQAKKMRVSEMRPEHFHELVTVCTTNIDCVITVLAAEPNQTFDAKYCRRMRRQRKMQMANNNLKCQRGNGPREVNSCTKECMELKQQQQQQQRVLEKKAKCVCTEINHIICIVLNFLVDCWNIFRNMKLYIYLSRFIKTLFDSARYVANHLRSKINNNNNTGMLKYH